MAAVLLPGVHKFSEQQELVPSSWEPGDWLLYLGEPGSQSFKTVWLRCRVWQSWRFLCRFLKLKTTRRACCGRVVLERVLFLVDQPSNLCFRKQCRNRGGVYERFLLVSQPPNLSFWKARSGLFDVLSSSVRLEQPYSITHSSFQLCLHSVPDALLLGGVWFSE